MPQTSPASASAPRAVSSRPDCARNVSAVLGPTNTGKTHLAIERMLGHETGVIGLPLRLLAREVYEKVAARAGAENVALITGEEKIKPAEPRYHVCTVESMPQNADVDFLAVDEIQLAGDPERGHVFTNRLFHARGRLETLLLGAQTMQGAIRDLLPEANFISRPRLSKLTYAGQKKISRLPRRSAIVAFSASDVYAIAELIRRQRGGAAVVLGALSPRTRNAQVELYQSGDVDFMVATDAIGMGLNLEVDHVAFAGRRKFDGRVHRMLTPGETGQIAGRAGRYMNDGTFGVTGECDPFDADLVAKLEDHDFEPVKILQWRNSNLDFSTLEALQNSLNEIPASHRLQRTRENDDVAVLERLAGDHEIIDLTTTPEHVARLWDACQVPDYRKISAATHAELVASLYRFLISDNGLIPEDWIEKQVQQAASTEGDIDTLANRISLIRTWTFVSNRQGWLADPEHWQARTREIEDNLSDALHQQLAQRFVDRRTSVLMKRLHDKSALDAEIEDDGKIFVENHYVGQLHGFRFTPDTHASGAQGKAARHAASKVLAQELARRADQLVAAKPETLALTRNGAITWNGEEVARLEGGEDGLKPGVQLLADEHMNAPDRDKVIARLRTWVDHHISQRIKPLVDLAAAADLDGIARGIAFRMVENFGSLKRDTVAEEVRGLDQTARAGLRKYGVRFGAYNIFFPALMKPDAAELLLLLWGLKHGAEGGLDPYALPEMPRPGLTSVTADLTLPEAFYRACGFHVCGGRAVRIDILERLGDQIRPLVSWKPDGENAEPPAGALGGGAFKVQPDMMAILGCSQEELNGVLKALGYRLERRPVTPPSANAPAAPENGEKAPGEAPPATDGEAPQKEMAAEVSDGETQSTEPEYEEIWRPRRRPERRKRPRQQDRAAHSESHGAQRKSRQADREQAGSTKPANDKRGPKKKRAAPGKAQPKPAANAGKRQPAVDPDSPFAALQGLKEKMERDMQERA
ncbi:helicase-related protein [Dichotomicrobium thermohalophilum]|uniref:ATP-dependent RNA helicase SUPV3L1/SUV3 n=1 Tax=Dichotomicrobium thermohalophilum TaxID=933063 RepID=A0A397PE04_9HYPH|nr:helicase-related protein [Dichotomicrobium thermohalophilum]RIA45397.1 ATP-dependent RNA helicase SUPV3L1/SUV3 [Dichotomicrobium thermohalophilum]